MWSVKRCAGGDALLSTTEICDHVQEGGGLAEVRWPAESGTPVFISLIQLLLDRRSVGQQLLQ